MISSLGKIGGGDTLEAWQRAINATPDDKWFVANPRTVTIPRSRLESVAKRKYRRWMHEEKEKLSVIIRAIPRTDGLTSREVAKLIERSVRSARRFLKAAHARRQIAGSGSVQRWTGRYVF